MLPGAAVSWGGFSVRHKAEVRLRGLSGAEVRLGWLLVLPGTGAKLGCLLVFPEARVNLRWLLVLPGAKVKLGWLLVLPGAWVMLGWLLAFSGPRVNLGGFYVLHGTAGTMGWLFRISGADPRNTQFIFTQTPLPQAVYYIQLVAPQHKQLPIGKSSTKSLVYTSFSSTGPALWIA